MNHARTTAKLTHAVSLLIFGYMGYWEEKFEVGHHVDPPAIHERWEHRAHQMRSSWEWARCTACAE